MLSLLLSALLPSPLSLSLSLSIPFSVLPLFLSPSIQRTLIMQAQTMHGLSLSSFLSSLSSPSLHFPFSPTLFLCHSPPFPSLVFCAATFLNFATFLHTFRRAANTNCQPHCPLYPPLPPSPRTVSAANIFSQRHFAPLPLPVLSPLFPAPIT